MVGKRLKGQQEEGEGLGEEGAGPDEFNGPKKFRKQRRKTKEEEDGLVSSIDDPLPQRPIHHTCTCTQVLTDSDSSGVSSEEDSDSQWWGFILISCE